MRLRRVGGGRTGRKKTGMAEGCPRALACPDARRRPARPRRASAWFSQRAAGGLLRVDRLQRPDPARPLSASRPTGGSSSAEKSGLIKVFDGLDRSDADRLRRSATNVHNFWDRGLLGLALDPELPDPAVRLRALHLRRRDRRHGAALGHAGVTSDPCPTRPARPPTVASSAAGSRGCKRRAT